MNNWDWMTERMGSGHGWWMILFWLAVIVGLIGFGFLLGRLSSKD